MIDCTLLRRRFADWPVRVGVKVIEESTEPVIPLDFCRQHLEMLPIDGDSDAPESHPDDPLILDALAAAVDFAEDYTGLCIVERVLEMGLDSFPRSGGVALKRPPVVEILSFTGADGSDGEMDAGDNYTLDDYSNPPMVFPVVAWPTVTRTPNLIKIRYRAGYRRELGEADSDHPVDVSDEPMAPPLPKSIKRALLLLMGHFMANREDSVEKALATIPLGATALLGTKRIETGFA